MITYVYRLLYKNLIVTTNQKSIIDIHTLFKEETKLFTVYFESLILIQTEQTSRKVRKLTLLAETDVPNIKQ